MSRRGIKEEGYYGDRNLGGWSQKSFGRPEGYFITRGDMLLKEREQTGIFDVLQVAAASSLRLRIFFTAADTLSSELTSLRLILCKKIDLNFKKLF